jgi:adenosylmethionine-8-amino-7-oxononanoate aminotransferase
MFGGISAGGLPANRTHFGPLLPDFHTVDRDSLQAMRDAAAYHGNDRIAAIIAEPVIGAGGVFPPTDGYLQGLRELCDEIGALLIFDEVINGFGRLGSWFAALHYGVTPDLLVFAKGVTSGYMPLGGVFVGPRVREPLEADPSFILAHGTTYAGTRAAARPAWRTWRSSIARSCPPARAGRQAPARGARHARRPPRGPRDPRRGPRAGDRPRGAARRAVVRRGAAARGVVARPSRTPTRWPFSPPLIITDEEIDELVEVAGAALADVAVAAG